MLDDLIEAVVMCVIIVASTVMGFTLICSIWSN